MNSNKITNAPKYTIRRTCRTCLKSLKNNIMESIFGLQSNDIESFRIMDELIIMNLKISRNDGLPQQICKECISRIRDFNIFRTESERSQEILENYFNVTLSDVKSTSSLTHYLSSSDVQNNETVPVMVEGSTVPPLPPPVPPAAEHVPVLQSVILPPLPSPPPAIAPLPQPLAPLPYPSPSSPVVNTNKTDFEFVNIKFDDPIAIIPEDLIKEEFIDSTNSKDDVADSKENIIAIDPSAIIFNDCKGNSDDETLYKKVKKEAKKIKLNKINDGNSENLQKRKKKLKKESTKTTKIKRLTATEEIKQKLCQDVRKYINTKRHVRRSKHAIEEAIPQCKYCNEMFNTMEEMEQHLKDLHPPDKPHLCPICKRGFRKPSNRTYHMETHIDVCSYKCDLCERCYKTKRLLNVHIKQKHIMSEHICPQCSKKFVTTFQFRAHLQWHRSYNNAVEHKYKCKYCDKGFHTRPRMQIHERIHTGEKPYLCNICGKEYRKMCTFKDHLKVHQNQRTFICRVCNKGFNHPATLYTHIKTHDGMRPFKCDICITEFARKLCYRKHMMRIHKMTLLSTGSKSEIQYFCEICKAHVDTDLLIAHVQMHTDAPSNGQINDENM